MTISEIDRISIEQRYFEKVKNKEFTLNKALRFIAVLIGRDYNDVETALSYIDQINMNEVDDTEKMKIGYAYLYIGELDKGWSLCKLRKYNKECETVYAAYSKHFKKEKEWERQNIIGKKLYILLDQGLGDIIMWARYLPYIKGAHIYIYALPRLKGMIPILDKILCITGSNNQVTVTDSIQDHDYWVCINDLSYIFNVKFNNWLKYYKYIYAKQHYIELWKPRLDEYKSSGKKLIGINCIGKGGDNDERKIDIDDIKLLLDKDGFLFFNLNIEHPIDHPNVIKHQYKVDREPFMDTMGIMQHLDMVVTTDTCMVHLAGAMNIKTMLLCIRNCEWRWFMGPNNKSIWYPSVTIFKQRKAGEWKGINEFFENMINEN